jgi:UDP-N-acetylglucosamine 2-epimerase (non-hydrolysing)
VSGRKVLFIFGTRPEAIKLCPVVQRLRQEPANFDVSVCATAQHRELLDQVLAIFGVTPNHDLNVMQAGQTLFQSTGRILAALEPVMAVERPDWVVVQGDTTTTLCGALAGFYARSRVAHVEAGLRTGDMCQPFPEEMNRVLASRITDHHFAATEWAAANLIREGVSCTSITVTGNTGIDAVLHVRDRLEDARLAAPDWPWLDPSKKLILVTAHRRESFGDGFERICKALEKLSRRDDVQIVYPVHPNPHVTEPVSRNLHSRPNIVMLEPLDYVSFVDLMRRARILLTDSGGVQEEGPSLGKPILVLREKTERPEAVEAGTVRLVGTDIERIIGETELLLENEATYIERCRIHNPYGDGKASERIAAVLREK